MNKLYIAALLSLALTGCASKGIKVSDQQVLSHKSPIWQDRTQEVSQIKKWEAKGKIAASHDGEGGNASFVWEQDKDFYKIRMFGPFGSGSAELTGSDRQVIFEEGDGSKRIGKTPEEILHQSTGLYIPVRGLMHWIKGMPSKDGSPRMHINGQGQLTFLEQSGWQIDYDRYIEVKGKWLPSKMELKREGMKVKLIIKNWEWH